MTPQDHRHNEPALESLLLNPIAIIQQSPPGSVLLSRYAPPDAAPEIVWLVRESPQHHALFEDPVMVDFHAGTIIYHDIYLFLILTRLRDARSTDHIYESWLDGFNSALGGDGILGELAIQPEIPLFLYRDASSPPRRLRAPNTLQPFARQALHTLKDLTAWREQEFEEARIRVRRHYASSAVLWELFSIQPSLHTDLSSI